MEQRKPWRREQKVALIREYRQHPILWQRGYSDKKHAVDKKKAWAAIGTKLNKPLGECQRKMNTYMSKYWRIRRDIKNCKQGTENSRALWFGYHHMRFMDLNAANIKQIDNRKVTRQSRLPQQNTASYSTDSTLSLPNCPTGGAIAKHEEDDLISVGKPSVPQQDTDSYSIGSTLSLPDCPTGGAIAKHEEDNLISVGKPSINSVSVVSSLCENRTHEEQQHEYDYTDAQEAVHPECLSSSNTGNRREYVEHPFHAFGQYVATELISVPQRAAILLQQQLHQCIIEAKLQALP